MDSKGKVTQHWHPITYCSKHTSPSEEQYKPYLLEFAALKYALDEFNTYIFGSAIEIETDCQALQDTLMRKRQSTTHT